MAGTVTLQHFLRQSGELLLEITEDVVAVKTASMHALNSLFIVTQWRHDSEPGLARAIEDLKGLQALVAQGIATLEERFAHMQKYRRQREQLRKLMDRAPRVAVALQRLDAARRRDVLLELRELVERGPLVELLEEALTEG